MLRTVCHGYHVHTLRDKRVETISSSGKDEM